mmetsp:Transcript_30905/g.52314  ORF Transcript_30905/g.52314 Transcript_30905/m.52314 type:complete len:152 (+) Transcript_30905:832-1287(+)
MDGGNYSRREEISANLGDVFHTPRLETLLVVLILHHSLLDIIRDDSLAKSSHAAKASRLKERHDSGQNRYFNAHLPTLFLPCVENVQIVEKLGDDEVSSGINLNDVEGYQRRMLIKAKQTGNIYHHTEKHLLSQGSMAAAMKRAFVQYYMH